MGQLVEAAVPARLLGKHECCRSYIPHFLFHSIMTCFNSGGMHEGKAPTAQSLYGDRSHIP